MTDIKEHKPNWLLWPATGFGLGFSPVASGTFGTLLGIPLTWLMLQVCNCVTVYTAIAVALCFLSIPVCSAAERYFKTKDDGRIVADEWMTFPVCMIGLPFTPEMVALCFVSNRLFDIWKPPPARKLQEIKGGLGIVIDDVLASVYSLGFNWAVYLFLQSKGIL